MARTPRLFEAKDGTRSQVPVLGGLMGPSGSGKTYSALRLATGIQQVTGGDIYVIDTEGKRALHYADQFKFKHVDFRAPFGSRDFLDAFRWCHAQGGKVIVVDSMSHEHSGEGGYLDSHEKEVERLSRGDPGKAERVKMAGWIKPAGDRRALIDGILQLNLNLIACFRAKEKTKPVKGGGIQELGFMPIAGEEFVFEMTFNCLLLPNAGGVPTWRSDQIGERLMMKLPEQFRDIFREQKPLDEATGRALAEWARGDGPAAVTTPTRKPAQEPRQAASEPEQASTQPETPKPAQRPAMEPRERVSNACLAMAKIEAPAALDKLWGSMQMADLRAVIQDDPELTEILEAAYHGRTQTLSEPQY